MDVTFGIAFVAGLASFLSPCVLPLVPAYIGYLGGRSLVYDPQSLNSRERWQTVTHGIVFILGFSAVFILLGLTFSVLGGWLSNIREFLAKLGGLIVVLFGIHMTGLFRFKFLEYDLRRKSPLNAGVGYLSSFFMGIFFSAGWSPCLGPVLASILTIAMNSGDAGVGVKLLGAYSLGMGIPFFLAALGISWVSRFLVKYRKVVRITEIIMGIVLIVVGIMLFTGTFALLARYGNFINPGI
jgi:cytochrome c-type biogenesis protein